MCTSFVSYGENAIIGMNFDISQRPIKVVLQGDSQFIILQSENGQFFPAFGVNSNGTFMNLQMVEPNDEGTYRRGKNCVHIMRLFEDVLGERIELSSLDTFLEEKTIVNVPNYSVHSLIAGKSRRAFIVQPGRNNIPLDSVDQEFLVLTNFSLRAGNEQASCDVQGHGQERYSKAYEMLKRNTGSFTKEIGFSILNETAQREGDYPTQFSMISIPEDKAIYFTLNADFSKVYEFSFADQQIRTYSGFLESNQLSLTKKGVLLSDLVAL